ncbi:MAG: tetratricopeptide repeat protein [Phycisphaerales bacterium]
MTRTKRRLVLVSSLLALLIMGGAGGYAALRWYRAHKTEAARVEGYRLFAEGDWEAALDPLSRYVGRNNSDVDALVKLAECRAKVQLANSRHLIAAAGYYKAALVVAPNNVDALHGLVDVYSQLGFGPELESAANSLLRIDPKDAAALQALARVARSRGQWKEATDATAKLIAIEPDNYLWRFLLLEILRGSGKDLAAQRAQIDAWIAAGEPDGRYRAMLARLQLLANQRDEAAASARQAAEAGLPDAALLGSLLDTVDALQLPDVAARAIQVAAERGVDKRQLGLMQAHRHWRAGRLNDARAALAETTAGSDDERAELLRWRVVVAELAGDRPTSGSALAELRSVPSEKVANGLWADAIVASRPTDESGAITSPATAMDALRKAMQVRHADTMLLLRAGDVLSRMGDVEGAARAYRDAFEREDRRWALVGIRLASSLMISGQTEQGFRLARELTALFPGDPGAYLVFAQACDALVQEGRSPALVDPSLPLGVTASGILRVVYDATDHRPEFAPPLAAVLASEGKQADAVKLGLEVAADARSSVDTLLSVATMLGDNSFGDTPLRLIAEAQKRGAATPALEAARCRVLLARGDAKGARAKATAALEAATDPAAKSTLARLKAEAACAAGDSDATTALAECLATTGDLETATFVVSQDAVWSDESLVEAAINRMRTLAGPKAPRTVISDANRVLRYHRTSKEQMAAATAAVNELIAVNRESPVALVTLARLLASSQPPDFVGAAKFLEQAVLLQPGRRDLYPEMIALFQSAGDYASASRYLQQYMQTSAQDPSASRIAASLLAAQGDYASAVPALKAIAEKSGKEADLIALADAQRRSGKASDAEKTLLQATKAPGRSALSTLAYAEFLARSGRVDDARRLVLDDANSSTPSLPPSERAALLARLELDFGDPAHAKAPLDEALRLLPDNPRVVLLAARYHRATGDERGAVAIVQEALRKSPNEPELVQFMAMSLLADPAASAQLEPLVEAIAKENPALASMLRVVRASSGQGDSLAPSADVLAAAVQLTEQYPSFAPGWITATQLHVAAGKLDEALRLAQRGMLRLPTEPAPAELATQLLLRLRRYPEARDAARAWRALSVESPFAPDLVLAELALRDRKPEQCLDLLSPYAQRFASKDTRGTEGIAIYALASLLTGRGEAAFRLLSPRLHADAEARSEWLRAVRQTPTPIALAALDFAVINERGDDSALAYAAEYVAVARRSDGTAAAAKARQLLDNVSAQAKALPSAQLLAADLACVTGDPVKGVLGYEGVCANIPEADREALLRWDALDGATRARLGDARFILLYASNNLASTLAAQRTELEKAQAAIDRALLMAPDDPDLWDTKARVLLARRELDEARNSARKARGLAGAGPSIDLTLAEIELAAGRADEARRLVDAAERAILADPMSDPLVIDALTAIKRRLDGAAKQAA